MPNPKRLLDALYGVPMQDGGRLPPGIKRATERAKESKSVLPVAGARQARQAIQGYLGMDPSFSVMDPEAQALESAYRGGETASVLGDLVASLTPFATASALSKASQVPGLAELIAYHGSPHKFKKFDASKIGTGEGAQAYGHGLYFAENPAVAKDYRKELATEVTIDGKPYFTGGRKVSSTGDRTIDDFLTWHVGDVPKAIEAARRMGFDEYIPKLEALKDRVKRVQGGALYTVDIPDEKIAQMLDLDKPLSQQPWQMKRISPLLQDSGISADLIPKLTGKDIMAVDGPMASWFGVNRTPKMFAEGLRQEGIPGVKYLDQVSRNKPLKDIKREFLNELPEDASIDEVVELLGTGTFSPKNEAIIKELAANDWLGFDYPAQSLSTVLSPSIRNYEVSPSLMRAINEAQEGGTRNFVLFPGEEQNIKMLDINGEPQMAKGGKVQISDNPDTMLLELTRAPRMQEGGKLPPGVRRAISQQRGTVAPIPGIKTPAEFIGGYVGADPRFSVMDPDADALERAYRAGEATSVIGDIVGSISPFATASTLARANALPGAAIVKAGAKKPPNVMTEFEKALAKSGPPTPAQIKKADAAEERVKKEKKFAKLRPSEQRQAIEAARSEALGTTVDRSSKVLRALLPGEEDIMTSLQGIKGYEVAKAVPAYAVKEAKVKRAKLREEPPTTPGPSASEKEWQDWGKQFGVDMTLSKPVSLGISDPVAKREVKIPGGLEGTFTIPDMFWMKANNVNPAALPKDVHDKLMLKFVRTHTVAEPDEVDIFNRLNFALLSPNAPLTSNEFLAMRARIRDKDELERLAARSGEEGLSKKMAEELGVQSGAKGGMGVLGTADLANQAELARMILQKPEMFMIQPGETMRDVTMRVMNQVPGLGPKTASLATPWLDLERANTSAVDLHMIRDATPRLLTDPDVGAAFRARMGKLLGVEPTMEAILAQPPNKVQEKAVQIVGGSDVSKVYRTKTGALNEIPEAALPEKLVYEPSALSNFNPFYSKVVEYVDESRGANPVLELFPEQWRKWDVIRERIEPHEFAHPDYRKLPKQSFSEMKAASDEHTAAGYRGQRPVMDETDWRKLYYGSLAPIGVGLGAGALSEMDTGTD